MNRGGKQLADKKGKRKRGIWCKINISATLQLINGGCEEQYLDREDDAGL